MLINRTANIGSHVAFFFLSRYAAVPRATYMVRTAPVYAAGESLRAIDERLREATSRSCNVHLADDSWIQASLLLRFGGLGVRRLTNVVLPAYIASVEASHDLVCTINHRSNGNRPARLTSAIESFAGNHTAPHSGAWLSAIPVEYLGLLLPDEAVRVGVALRLGTRVQQPHR